MTKREKLEQLLKGKLPTETLEGLNIPIQFWAKDFERNGNSTIPDAVQRFKKK